MAKAKYALLIPNIRDISSFDPLSSLKVAIMALFWDTWHLLSNFGTKEVKIAIFLIGGQNRNILKFRGLKVQCSVYINSSERFIRINNN